MGLYRANEGYFNIEDAAPELCHGCRAACGHEELYLDDGPYGEPALFRSWRCLIRHAMKQHALSSESYPPAVCEGCGARYVATASDHHPEFCYADVSGPAPASGEFTLAPKPCGGIIAPRWEDINP